MIRIKKKVFIGLTKNFKKLSYYQHFDELACGMKWSHLDIYFSLEKKQKELEEAKGNDVDFLKEQLKISMDIIQQLAPKMIVVGNAYASRLIKNHFDCKFDDEIGTYRIEDLNNIPLFLSGMFTGQKALDVESRKRLVWHINKTKNRSKKLD
jgi:hypothetical protein